MRFEVPEVPYRTSDDEDSSSLGRSIIIYLLYSYYSEMMNILKSNIILGLLHDFRVKDNTVYRYKKKCFILVEG